MEQAEILKQKRHVAYAYYNANRYEKAKNVLEEILKEDLDDVRALYLLGCCEERMDHDKVAKEIFESLGTSRLADSAFGKLGKMAYSRRMYHKAEQYYQRAIELAPNEAAHYAYLARVQSRKRKSAYEESLARALSLNPNDCDTLQLAFHISNRKDRDTQKEEEFLKKMQEVNIGPAWLSYFHGLTAWKKKNYEEAVECVRYAYSLEPSSACFIQKLKKFTRRLKWLNILPRILRQKLRKRAKSW